MKQEIVAGHLFTYSEKRRFLRRQLGAGQVLGTEDGYDIVFVRIFDVSGDALTPIIGFVPLTIAAFDASEAQVVKWLSLPDDWETLRNEWRTMWRSGEAGVFSLPLREITRDTFETVDQLSDGSVIDLAFPKRSESGRFDTISAYVRR